MKAFAKFHTIHPDSELHLYGQDFGAGQTAESWANKKSCTEGMVFHGAIPHRKLMDAISNSDLLLHPALEESFGLSIAEAMSMGLPVVAGEASGAVPWVVGDGGVLCDVREENAIYQAIEQVLEPENYVRCSVAARVRVESMFTVSAVASAYLEAYQLAIDKELARCCLA